MNNIEEVSFQFRTGQAPPSSWFSDVNAPPEAEINPSSAKLERRQAEPIVPAPVDDNGSSPDDPAESHGRNGALDPSYHTRLIDVLTFRARYGSFGSSLNSAGCALPAFSERLGKLEDAERDLVNNYTAMHKPIAGRDDVPSAMFFWAGISNYDPSVRSDLIQTVVFYGDGCAANPRQGLCVYAAEYSNFRYNPEDHMCMGSNMPVFYPVESNMTVNYRTQNGFRTQEAWIDGKMVSYLRSAGDQVMNSFVITQECKSCTWPLSEQVYENIRIKFSKPEKGFDLLQRCMGGARSDGPARELEGGRVWAIDRVTVPSGKHVTSLPPGIQQGGAGGTVAVAPEQPSGGGGATPGGKVPKKPHIGGVAADPHQRGGNAGANKKAVDAAPAPGTVPALDRADAAKAAPVKDDPASGPPNGGKPANSALTAPATPGPQDKVNSSPAVPPQPGAAVHPNPASPFTPPAAAAQPPVGAAGKK